MKPKLECSFGPAGRRRAGAEVGQQPCAIDCRPFCALASHTPHYGQDERTVAQIQAGATACQPIVCQQPPPRQESRPSWSSRRHRPTVGAAAEGVLSQTRIVRILTSQTNRPMCQLALLQISPYVSHLSLYDIAGTPGVAADISHINSKAVCKV